MNSPWYAEMFERISLMYPSTIPELKSNTALELTYFMREFILLRGAYNCVISSNPLNNSDTDKLYYNIWQKRQIRMNLHDLSALIEGRKLNVNAYIEDIIDKKLYHDLLYENLAYVMVRIFTFNIIVDQLNNIETIDGLNARREEIISLVKTKYEQSNLIKSAILKCDEY